MIWEIYQQRNLILIKCLCNNMNLSQITWINYFSVWYNQLTFSFVRSIDIFLMIFKCVIINK